MGEHSNLIFFESLMSELLKLLNKLTDQHNHDNGLDLIVLIHHGFNILCVDELLSCFTYLCLWLCYEDGLSLLFTGLCFEPNDRTQLVLVPSTISSL